MGELWCHRVEGDSFPWLVVESDRVIVSTASQTLTVDLHGEVLDRCEGRDVAAARGPSPVRVGNDGYLLQAGELLRFDANERLLSRKPVPDDLFARHRERLSSAFRPDTPAGTAAAWVNDRIKNWSRSVSLAPDPARERLLAIGQYPPWLAAIRTDGTVDWVRIVGKTSDCCNFAAVISRDGTLAHVTSCGWRLTFLTTEGEVISTHGFASSGNSWAAPNDLSTEGRGIAFVTLLCQGVVAYRPTLGEVGALEIPGITQAKARDGVLYCLLKDPLDGVLLKAFEAPA